MADLTTKTALSVCATVGSRLPDLAIKNGQLIFIQDKHVIAFDFGGVRRFYNQIIEIDTEAERDALSDMVSGAFYFVIDTACLWTYRNKWYQLTTPPKEVLFIGTELPALGSNRTLYVDKLRKEISVWDSDTFEYIVVAEKTKEMSADDIDALFLKIFN